MARELICAAFLLALATVYYVLASGIGRSALADEVGPAGLPLAYAALLAGLAIALALKALAGALLARRAAVRPADEKSNASYVLLRAGGTLAIGAAYVLLVSVLGYWLSIALLVPAMAVYQGQTFDRKLVAIAVTGATVFWGLFVWLLGIPMPPPWFRA